MFKDLRLCVNCPTSFEENQTVLKYLPERRTSHCFQVSVAADCEKSSNCDSKETQMVNDSLANTGSVSHPFIRSFFHRRRSSILSGNTPLCTSIKYHIRITPESGVWGPDTKNDGHCLSVFLIPSVAEGKHPAPSLPSSFQRSSHSSSKALSTGQCKTCPSGDLGGVFRKCQVQGVRSSKCLPPV